MNTKSGGESTNKITAEKRALRSRLLAERMALSEGEREEASRAIRARCRDFIDARANAHTVKRSERAIICLYWPVKNEPDLLPLARALLREGRKVAFPAIAGAELVFRIVRNLEDDMAPGAYGICAPGESCPVCPEDEERIVFIPGIAFDQSGARLGYGKGYFDRFLARRRVTSVGVTYASAIVERVPQDLRDQAARFLCSERGLTETAGVGAISAVSCAIRAPVCAEITPPGSKNITNRALIISALAEGESVLRGFLYCEDTARLCEALAALGFVIRHEKALCRVEGGLFRAARNDSREIFAGDSGTAMRFLAGLLTLMPAENEYVLTGGKSLSRRPMGELARALNALGARIGDTKGFAPIRVGGGGLAGGCVRMSGETSSQFISSILLAAPYAQTDVRIHIESPPVSLPYIAQTCAMMRDAGAELRASADLREIVVTAGAPYRAREYTIESDASAAVFFFALAAIAGGSITVHGMRRAGLQADLAFLDVLEKMGCEVCAGENSIRLFRGQQPLRAVDADMRAFPDAFPAFAVCALFAEGTSRVRNIAHARHKESDRIQVMARGLRAAGARVRERADGCAITPRARYRPAKIDCADDHRAAMAFTIASLFIPGLRVQNPRCIHKSYPAFLYDLGCIIKV